MPSRLIVLIRPGGIMDTGDGSIASDSHPPGVSAGIHHVGIHLIVVAAHIHDAACHLRSVIECEDAAAVLVVEPGARIDYGFEQVIRAELASGGGKVRPMAPPSPLKR